MQQKSNQKAVSVSTNDSDCVSHSGLIGLDLWKQLKRVTISVFSGDKKTYQNWKGATFVLDVTNDNDTFPSTYTDLK